MSKQLYSKLCQPGVLPTNDKCLQSMLMSHSEAYDGFSFLTHIIPSHVPALWESKKTTYPSWEYCNPDLFQLQDQLTLYYQGEKSMLRTYTSKEKSREYLQLYCVDPHKQTALRYLDILKKIDDADDPPSHLLINAIA